MGNNEQVTTIIHSTRRFYESFQFSHVWSINENSFTHGNETQTSPMFRNDNTGKWQLKLSKELLELYYWPFNKNKVTAKSTLIIWDGVDKKRNDQLNTNQRKFAPALKNCNSYTPLSMIYSFKGENSLKKIQQSGTLTVTVDCTVDVSETPETNHEVPMKMLREKKSRACFDIPSMFENPKFSDVTISVGGFNLPAHKFVLSSGSGYFFEMWQGEMAVNQNPVFIANVDCDVFRELLRFIYTYEALNIEEMADRLFLAAQKFEVPDLLVKCEEVLCAQVCITDVAKLWIFANEHGAESLKTQVRDFFNANAEKTRQTPGFQKMIDSHQSLAAEIMRALEPNVPRM